MLTPRGVSRQNALLSGRTVPSFSCDPASGVARESGREQPVLFQDQEGASGARGWTAWWKSAAPDGEPLLTSHMAISRGVPSLRRKRRVEYNMSNLVLNYLIDLISGLALPSFILIIASWRVARLWDLTTENYQDRVDESVANTIKEQLSEKVITPLFTENNVVLPPGRTSYDVIDTLVPGDDVELLASLYNDLAQFGIQSDSYILLLQTVNTLWGGG